MTTKPQTKYLQDYRPPAYWVDGVALRVAIHDDQTEVSSRLQLRRNSAATANADLILDGRQLELRELKLNGEVLTPESYRLTDEHLIIPAAPADCVLEVVTRIQPERNTSLEGFYRSGPVLCTQCEAHGFSRITYFPDRPDVLARFTVTLEADARRYPLLLANGNEVGRGSLPGGRHWLRWEDPFPKPSYLFAMVAGDLACLQDKFRTISRRDVALRLYVEPGEEGRAGFALESLKQAMRWDEEAYGLEYDLDLYMIVAVRDFNMGAMENKGLNLFNSRYIMADARTATDMDFEHVRAVIGHEYFHNWTGNRVTCRDWFQLSLKEGLTVFREQQFSAAMGSAAVKRLDGVRYLRTHQFAEDAGPLAHPVQPQSYIEVNNFYTLTVYEKGAELIRMLHTLVGEQNFRAGLRRYLADNDGRAATIDDWLAAHAAVSGRDLSLFRRWYTQAGTPQLMARGHYDAPAQRYALTLSQQTPPTPGQPDKYPLLIPVRVAFFAGDGRLLHESLLELSQAEQSFSFEQIQEEPIPSLLRGFSAPVRLEYQYSAAQRSLLATVEADAFNRSESLQQLMLDALLAELRGEKSDKTWLQTCRSVLQRLPADFALAAEMLSLPSEQFVAEQMESFNPTRLVQVRDRMRRQLAQHCADQWRDLYRQLTPTTAYRYSADECARRRLQGLALSYLGRLQSREAVALATAQSQQADNMTDRWAALAVLNEVDCPQRDQALEAFYSDFEQDPLTLDKWFALQAMSPLPNAVERIESLLAHSQYDARNPNRVRAVLGSFTQQNLRGFHQADGSAYRLAIRELHRLDAQNPQLAARLAQPLTHWQRLAEPWRAVVKTALTELAKSRLSADLYEVVHKGLSLA